MTKNKIYSKKCTNYSAKNNPLEQNNNGLVQAEKVFYGKVIMYSANCPSCDETQFEPCLDFKCDICLHEFKGTIDSLRIEVSSAKRKRPSPDLKKEILDQQEHKCYWCDRDFDIIYFRYNSIQRLLPNWDHIIPHSYSFSNADDNFVASCSICNSFKHSKVFKNKKECKAYIKQRWDKHLRLGKIIFLEDDYQELEKNCKKNSLSFV